MDPTAVDDIIKRLWTDVDQLTEHDIINLCATARVIFLKEPSLLRLKAPIKICGDIHGQYSDLLRIFNYFGCPPTTGYLFLGNYVDEGEQSIETVCLLLAYKIRYPKKFFLLRGAHEIAIVNRNHGLYDECKSKFHERLWQVFNDCFNCLPVAAVVDKKIFCVHAGLSPHLDNLTQINNEMRPAYVPKDRLLFDLLWSNPGYNVQGWAINTSRWERPYIFGQYCNVLQSFDAAMFYIMLISAIIAMISYPTKKLVILFLSSGCNLLWAVIAFRRNLYTFGQDTVSQFLEKYNLDLICRSHQVVGNGYEFFGDKKQLVTIFSVPNYYEGNAGAIMSVDENFRASFHVTSGTDFNFSITGTCETRRLVALEQTSTSPLLPHKPSNNKEIKRGEKFPAPTAGGHGSTSRRKSTGIRVKPSFKRFSPEEIKDATDNFSESLIIGRGGYGVVYKCQLCDRDVAVKKLGDQGDQGNQGLKLKEYINEMDVLGRMRHENLIHLIGTCFKFRALIYEYIPNGSLETCLKDRPGELTWEIRIRIVYEICTALKFLHENKPEPLVHGDLKPQNVLLGTNFKVKLADFGLCRYLDQGKDSRVRGSDGYLDPQYLETLEVNTGMDVYSFGKTVVRILTGKFPPEIFREVYEATKTGSFVTIVDPTVGNWPKGVVSTLARFALRSTKRDRYKSEFMGNFYSELEKILKCIGN